MRLALFAGLMALSAPEAAAFQTLGVDLHAVVRKRELAQVRFDGALTREQLPGHWGSGEVWATAELAIFPLDSGESLWMLFDRDTGKLLTANLQREGRPVTMLYDGNVRAKRRRLDQIDFRRLVPRETIAAVWGEADYHSGSGVDYRHYIMADGTDVMLMWTPCIRGPGFKGKPRDVERGRC